MSSTVEQVKARLTILDVVSSYLTLEKAGANYRARCPFHNEKTPSFYVSPVRETYHCFGCNHGGDIFTFVEEIEGLDFLGSLKILALRAGVPLEPINREKATAKERLHNVMEAAVTYFTHELGQAPAVTAYLKTRGLSDETITNFRLGFATSAWRGLTDYLIGRGFTEQDLTQSGLVVRSSRDGRIFDRFRQRIMFPIADGAGRIIAFSGRFFGEETGTEAKYINSPETLLYDKSRALYLFDKAKLAIRRADRCILVEGQFDAVLSHQAGITETVAVSGTALSGNHLDLISRLTKKIVMAFDSDPAGVKASNRGITLALEHGLEVRVAMLPQGKDPADVIRVGGGVWEKALSQTTHVIDFLITMIKDRGFERREFAHELEREVYPYLTALINPIDQAYFIRNIADLTALPETVIREGVTKAKGLKTDPRSSAPTANSTAPPLTRRHRLEALILGFIIWQEKKDETVKDLVVKHWGEELLARRQAEARGRESEQALKAELTYSQSQEPKLALNNLLQEWQVEIWREELSEAVHLLKSIDPQTKPELVKQYLKKCQELSHLINKKI